MSFFFFFLKNQSSLVKLPFFVAFYRWRIMELFDGNVESPKKGPENLT